jgi:hypothetical protein
MVYNEVFLISANSYAVDGRQKLPSLFLGSRESSLEVRKPSKSRKVLRRSAYLHISIYVKDKG